MDGSIWVQGEANPVLGRVYEIGMAGCADFGGDHQAYLEYGWGSLFWRGLLYDVGSDGAITGTTTLWLA